MSAVATYNMDPTPRRKACWTGTPEVYFSKVIDNSRLVKVEDPNRGREMKQFGIALCCLFLLVMTYALQHFKAIEYGYKIEALKSRIDALARHYGMVPPQAGQVVRMDGSSDAATPVMASMTPVSMISVR